MINKEKLKMARDYLKTILMTFPIIYGLVIGLVMFQRFFFLSEFNISAIKFFSAGDYIRGAAFPITLLIVLVVWGGIIFKIIIRKSRIESHIDRLIAARALLISINGIFLALLVILLCTNSTPSNSFIFEQKKHLITALHFFFITTLILSTTLSIALPPNVKKKFILELVFGTCIFAIFVGLLRMSSSTLADAVRQKSGLCNTIVETEKETLHDTCILAENNEFLILFERKLNVSTLIRKENIYKIIKKSKQ